MKQFIVFLLIILSFKLSGQSKFTVYYDYGKSQPKDGEKDKLQKWLWEFNPIDIDSIQVIGFADSTGRVKNNLILSEKRAESARKIISGVFRENIPLSIIPRGEKNKNIEAKDRRVDIKVYVAKRSESIATDSTINDNIKRCYLVDYYLLQCCYISDVTVKNKAYVKLEIETSDLRSRKKIVHFSMSLDDSGNVTLKKLKWVSKTTGELWWTRSRYEALIPFNDFIKHKVVVVAPGPCDSCFRDPVINAKFRRDSCLAQDIFLNKNIQYKLGFLRFRSVKIRVPGMYVNKGENYYKDFNRALNIIWETKRKQKSYYYTKLPLYKDIGRHTYIFHPISKMMVCCWLKDYGGGGINCGGVRFWGRENILGIEAGNNKFLKTNVPCIGLTINLSRQRAVARTLIAIDTGLKINVSMRYQYHFYSLPAAFFCPFQRWRNPGFSEDNFPEVRAFAGTELRGYKYDEKHTFIEQNIHLGLRYFGRGFSIFSQYGYALNIANVVSKKSYPIWQTGIEYFF